MNCRSYNSAVCLYNFTSLQWVLLNWDCLPNKRPKCTQTKAIFSKRKVWMTCIQVEIVSLKGSKEFRFGRKKTKEKFHNSKNNQIAGIVNDSGQAITAEQKRLERILMSLDYTNAQGRWNNRLYATPPSRWQSPIEPCFYTSWNWIRTPVYRNYVIKSKISLLRKHPILFLCCRVSRKLSKWIFNHIFSSEKSLKHLSEAAEWIFIV